MKILITGGAGYVGSHVALEALLAGHEVCIYDNYRNSVPRVGHFLGSMGAQVVVADILDQTTLGQTFKTFRPDMVIHMAGLKRVDESQDIPLEYHRANVVGTLNVLTAMENADVGKLVFSSSAAIYAESSYAVREEDKIAPKSVYGQTKVICERMISDYAATGRIDAVSLRYFNPVAAHPMLPERRSATLMGVVTAVAAGRLPKLTIYGDGTAVRDFVHVRDVAAAHLFAIPLGGHAVYNVGTGKGTSVMDLVIHMEQVIRRDLPKEFVEPRKEDIHHSVANCNLINRETGWKSTRSVEEMCRDAWEAESLRLSSER